MDEKVKFSRPVPPFVRYCAATIPTVFDDSLSYYECLCALWKWLQDNVIETINNNATITEDLQIKVKELKEFVENYFDNLDVQEEINNKLDEMAENGQLESIIGAYLNDGFLNDNFYVYPIRKGRYLTKTTVNPNYDATVDFPNMQGGCYVGNNHFIQARIVNSNTDRTQLQEINLETGEVIRTNILQLQHANSLTYDPNTNRLYVCSLTLSGVNTQYIYVLDYTTWNIIKTIDLSSQLEATEGTHSISYDEKTGKFILGAELKTYNSMRFFELDIDTEELTEITMIDSYGLLSGTGANNDITVYDNHLYLLKHRPNCISEWDLTSGKLIKVYNIPLITPEGWTQGEGENITYSPTEGIFYFGAMSPDCNGGYVTLNSYYTFDLKHNEPVKKNFSLIGDIVKTVYVDSDSTVWNPTGTSFNSAFSSIGEATQLLNLTEIAGLMINLKKDKTYPYVNIYSEKVVAISCSEPSDYTNTIVNGISVEDSNNVYVTSVVVEGIGTHAFDFRIRRSNLEITSVVLKGNHTEHIVTWHSKIRFKNITYATGVTGNLFNCSAENEIICLDGTPSYNAIGNMPVINKPVKVASITGLNSTAKASTINNMDLVKIASRLFVVGSGAYYQNAAFITVQTTDGGNRNFAIIYDGTMCRYQLVFDYTNNRFTGRLVKAYNLETGSDVTSTFTATNLEIFAWC